jgi:ABC-type multidrug transport system fused ATPase/permease subunit
MCTHVWTLASPALLLERIAIARAIIKDPRVLVLDEALSAQDASSELLVQEALERLMCDRTVILIAHRLSSLRRADRIAVLHNGSVAELGTRKALLSKENGLFRALFDKYTSM